MIVRLSDLTIRYGTYTAVDRVSVDLPAGAVGLLGRNGAGKSSILKSLLGLVEASAGERQVLDLPKDAPSEEIRARVGYMPEREAYIPGLNGYETVRIAGQLSGLPAAVAARRAHEVLYFVGLGEQRYRPVSGYSTGMKQKTKLAVALVHDPQLLFLDEPTNGLDPQGRQQMLALIADLARSFGKSIILSSHILSDVEQVCRYVVLLERGRLLAAGPVDELTVTDTRVVHVALRGDEARLETALAPLCVEAPVRSGDGAFRLTVAEDLPAQALFRAVAAAGGAVRELREHRRSLEDVFLHAVRVAGEGAGAASIRVGGVGAGGRVEGTGGDAAS
jgi:ABC-2 type transport system ATP-binding protein